MSPRALELDGPDPAGSLTLYNPGTRPEEVQVRFGLGYPRSDPDGNVSVEVPDTAPADESSAVPWLGAFPQRLVLHPGQRQVVRILARPPADLPEGEHWARVLIRSRAGRPTTERWEGDVAVPLDVQNVVAVAIRYRHGHVWTDVGVAGAVGEITPHGVVGTVDLVRWGNAAFVGRLLTEVLDGEGAVLGSREEKLVVYRNLRHRPTVANERMPAGARPAAVRFTVDTPRSDASKGAALPIHPVIHTVPLR